MDWYLTKLVFLWICLVTLVGVMSYIVYCFGIYTGQQIMIFNGIDRPETIRRAGVYGGLIGLIVFWLISFLTIIFI